MPSYDPDPFQYLRKRALARGTVGGSPTPTPTPTDNLRAGQTQMLAVYPFDNGETGFGHLAAFETMLGTQTDRMIVFWNFADWTAFRATADSLPDYGRRCLYSMPLTVGSGSTPTTTLAQVAAGAADSHFNYAFDKLLASQPTGIIRVRLGWEANGDYFPWTAINFNADYIAAFRRVYGLGKAKGARLRFEWNTNNINEAAVAICDPENIYPGDAYCDNIGQDCYFNNGYDNADPAIAWGYRYNGFSRGLLWGSNFAAAHGKPWHVSEWGINTDTYALIVTSMAAFLRSTNALSHGYWDATPNPTCKITPTSNPVPKPNAVAAFVTAFGPPIITTAASTDVELNTATNLSITSNHPATYTLVSADPGITLVGSTLTLASQATTGTRTATVRATDNRGLTVDKAISFVVLAAYVFTNTEAASHVTRVDAVAATPTPRFLKQAIDNLTTVLKANGYTSAKSIYFRAIHDGQGALLEFKGGVPSTAVNGAVFTAYRGFMGKYDGVAPQYVNTNIASNAASPFVSNNGMYLIWETNETTDAAPAFAGGGSIVPRNAAGNMVGGIDTFTLMSGAVPSSIGVFSAIRSSSSASRIRRNGVTIATNSAGSAGLSSETFKEDCSDPLYPGPHRLGFIWIGAALTDTQEANIVAGLQTYAAAVGAPI